MIGLAGYQRSLCHRAMEKFRGPARTQETRPTTRRPVTVSPGQRLLARDRPPAGIL
jgi:hypothetical protein